MSSAQSELPQASQSINLYYDGPSGLLRKDVSPVDDIVIRRSLNYADRDLHPINTPEWFEEDVDTARRFVANLTGCSPETLSAAVRLVKASPVNADGFVGNNEHMGAYHPLEDVINVSGPNQSTPRKSWARVAANRTLAHEFAHSTGDHKDMSITAVIKNEADVTAGGLRRYLHLFSSRSKKTSVRYESAYVNQGMVKSHLSRRQSAKGNGREVVHKSAGAFFEEGFAELVGIAYNESQGVDFPGETLTTLATSADVGVPARYWSVSDDGEGMMLGPSALAAYGLDLLEGVRKLTDPDGNTIMNLLIDSRHSHTRTEAMRELVKVVNKIEPGLYKRLNHLQLSSKEDTIAGLNNIRQATKRKDSSIA